MKLATSLVAVSLVTAMAASPGFAAKGNGNRSNATCASCGVMEVDSAEAAMLTFMREEEKVARDLYLNFGALWTSPQFENVAASEQRHMDAVKRMLDKYGLADPAAPDAIGWFSDTQLQELYDDLMARGETSNLEALLVGALVEEVDIEDLQNAIAETDNADLVNMYANLMRGSRNHLRIYVTEIERLGVVYEAQHLDQAMVDDIVDSPMERGSKAGGKGNKRGRRGRR